jgi:hypothetical protein
MTGAAAGQGQAGPAEQLELDVAEAAHGGWCVARDPGSGPVARSAAVAACRSLRRSPSRRSRASSLASARSNAAYLSSAAASARMTGPRDRIVSSTRSRRSDWRGFRSAVTSTSTLIALLSSFPILPSLAEACLRKRS